ncbi:E3 ubiquitin-protein ligase FANCL-like [Teleopsis dalmanni]|uniref:E3 ubiquitin-protein ligase FANCL-like n=1 Tax=Teleopsis dalmanni TaxID=139649 RepID=UPI0018CEABBF|nr:E3 ubiquitin-protein ligase FANCL-like [Teleopsis dalmanni]
MPNSEDLLEQLLLRYEGITSSHTRKSELCLSGIVQIKETWFTIKLICPKFPKLEEMHLSVQQSIKVETFTETYTEIEANWNVFDLIENLPKLMNKNGIQKQKLITDAQQLELQQNIYTEIAILSKSDDFEIELNEAFTLIRFSKFNQQEQHFLELSLPSLQITKHSLPDCINWETLFQNFFTLNSLLEQFRKYLEELHEFYDNFVDIDELCHVLQPRSPSTKDNWRLFLIREHVFLKLVITDPFAPISSMSLKILGPTEDVEQLRRTYSEGLCNWDAELDIHKNLLRIFDLCFFPMRPGIDGELIDGAVEEQQFCNICYCYHLDDGDIPLISCDNRQCTMIYHAVCLREWFNTLSDGKTFLKVSFGNCPFCKATLSTSFVELIKN